MRRLVILRGKPASGKSTAYASLKKSSKMKKWVFADHPAIKEMFSNLKERTSWGKLVLFEVLKIAMESGKDIITEEMSEETLRKHINSHIKKNKYKIITFQFEVSKKKAYKKEAERRIKIGLKSRGKKWVDTMHKMHEQRVDKKGIVINTTGMGKKQVVNFILKELK